MNCAEKALFNEGFLEGAYHSEVCINVYYKGEGVNKMYLIQHQLLL